jgi:hypothetical protein
MGTKLATTTGGAVTLQPAADASLSSPRCENPNPGPAAVAEVTELLDPPRRTH